MRFGVRKNAENLGHSIFLKKVLHVRRQSTVLRTSIPFCSLVCVKCCANIWLMTAMGGVFVGLDLWGIESQSNTLSPAGEIFFNNTFFPSKNGVAVKCFGFFEYD